jgi:hypothetical protein
MPSRGSFVELSRLVMSLVSTLSLLPLSACRSSSGFDAGCDGWLFGQPVPATGLDSSQCQPSCPRMGHASKNFSEDELQALTAWHLVAPFDALTMNPFDAPVSASAAGVCAVVVADVTGKQYHLQTFADEAAARDAGAVLTHHDGCGLCSTLADLAVYARHRDLGTPVKQCGLDNFSQPMESLLACLERLGFTQPCAQIWAFNVRHTQAKCLGPCISPGTYHLPDGTLNDCLACDERESGPVFKAIAGRTRRNTGLATSICRPCSEARAVSHDYPR